MLLLCTKIVAQAFRCKCRGYTLGSWACCFSLQPSVWRQLRSPGALRDFRAAAGVAAAASKQLPPRFRLGVQRDAGGSRACQVYTDQWHLRECTRYPHAPPVYFSRIGHGEDIPLAHRGYGGELYFMGLRNIESGQGTTPGDIALFSQDILQAMGERHSPLPGRMDFAYRPPGFHAAPLPNTREKRVSTWRR